MPIKAFFKNFRGAFAIQQFFLKFRYFRNIFTKMTVFIIFFEIWTLQNTQKQVSLHFPSTSFLGAEGAVLENFDDFLKNWAKIP